MAWKSCSRSLEYAHGLDQLGLEVAKIVESFEYYVAQEGLLITRAAAEQRMLEKLTRSLTEDIARLLPAGVRFADEQALQVFERVWKDLVMRLRGDGWKSTGKAVAELRAARFPSLLNGVI